MTTLKRNTSSAPIEDDDTHLINLSTTTSSSNKKRGRRIRDEDEDEDQNEDEDGVDADDDDNEDGDDEDGGDNSDNSAYDENGAEDDYAFPASAEYTASDIENGTMHRGVSSDLIESEAVDDDYDGTGAQYAEDDKEEPNTSDEEFIDDSKSGALPGKKWTNAERLEMAKKRRRPIEKEKSVKKPIPTQRKKMEAKSSMLQKPKQKPAPKSSSNGIYASVLASPPVIKKLESKQLGVVKVPDKYMHVAGLGKKITQLQFAPILKQGAVQSVKAKVTPTTIDVRNSSKKAKPKKIDAIRAEARLIGLNRRGIKTEADEDDDDEAPKSSKSSSPSIHSEGDSSDYKRKQELVDDEYTSTLNATAASLLLYPSARISADDHPPKPAAGCLYQLHDVFVYDGVEYTVTKPFLKPSSCKQKAKGKPTAYDLSSTTRDHLLTAYRAEIDRKSQSHYHFFVANFHFTPLMVGEHQNQQIQKRSLSISVSNLDKKTGSRSLKSDKRVALERLALANDNLKYYNQGTSAQMVELILHPEVYKELRIEASMKKIKVDSAKKYSYACHSVMDILTLDLVNINVPSLEFFLTKADKVYKKAEEVLHDSLDKGDVNYSVRVVDDFKKSLDEEYAARLSKSSKVSVGQFIMEHLICLNILTSGRSADVLQRRFFRAHLLDHQLPALDEEEVETYKNLDLSDFYDSKPVKGRLATDPTQQPIKEEEEEGDGEEEEEAEIPIKKKKIVSLHASEPKRKKLKKMKAEAEVKAEEAEVEPVDPYAEDEAAAREARELDDTDSFLSCIHP